VLACSRNALLRIREFRPSMAETLRAMAALVCVAQPHFFKYPQTKLHPNTPLSALICRRELRIGGELSKENFISNILALDGDLIVMPAYS
jgi:hypothetical protein